MKTIAKKVEEIISQKPFLEELMAQELINYTSLARNIQAQVEASVGRDLNTSAIVMALKRYVPQVDFQLQHQLELASADLGDITVRSNLSDYTFRNSISFIENQMKLIEVVSKREDVFFTFSQGVYEVNIVISTSFAQEIEAIFKTEEQLSKLDSLSSVTMRLPSSNVRMVGLYYYILKKLAWSNINIIEVISTTNEFTIIVEDKDIGKAFSVINDLRA